MSGPGGRGRTGTGSGGSDTRESQPADGRSAGSSHGAGDPKVTGVVLGDAGPAAPGLRGAQAGGRTRGPALALTLAAALLLCAALGARLEQRRPGALA